MKYDLEIVIPVGTKYFNRIEDLKKHGIFNIKDRKILLTLITSGEKIENLDKDWQDLDVNVVFNDNKNYASNVYFYILYMSIQSRWIMKIDDDTCTDIDGLLSKLDEFYCSEEKYYLACSLSRFINVSPESYLGDFYEKFFGKKFLRMNHEIECSIFSHVALEEVRSNKRSFEFLEQRCNLQGGATDVALAYAFSISKIYPIDFPFVTHLPWINEFSIFGGEIYHIHGVSKEKIGDNFQDWDRCGDIQYKALTKAILNEVTEKEKKIIGKKFLMETEKDLILFSFFPNKTLNVKFDNKNYVWLEDENLIKIFFDYRQIYMTLELEESGCLHGKGPNNTEFNLHPVN